jgi:16S rRNA (adenine1518-N6/adenine1519-N6)-dimethyltransferase
MAVLMYQKEFAERMVAIPKTKPYSRISVMLYYHANCELIEKVPKTCFFPQPKVDSSIVRLSPRKNPAFDVIDESFFFDLTKTLFSHRRKKIKTTLRNFYDLKYKSLPYLENRVDELNPEEIGELSNLIYSYLKKSN